MIGKPLDLDVPGVKANFLSAFTDEGAVHQEITGAPIASSQETETYTWLDELNAFDFWDNKGVIPEATLNKWKYTLANRPYGANWTVNEREVRYDKTGQIMLRARQLGKKAGHWYNDKLAVEMETNSVDSTNYPLFDLVSFFHASHPTTAGSTVANLGDSALTQDSLETTIYTMRGFIGRSGDRLGVTPTHIVVPPELEFTAARIIQSPNEPDTAHGAINPLHKRLNMIVLDSLTDANDWYVLDLSNPIRPFFMQESLKLRTLAQGPSDLADEYIKSRNYTFSADGECAFGMSLGFLGYKHAVI